MPALRIPEGYVPALKKLAALSQDQMRALADALRDVRPALKPSMVAEQVAPNVPTLQKSDIEELIELINVLFSAYEHQEGAALSDFIDELVEAVHRSSTGPEEPQQGWAEFRSSLADLLTIEPLRISSRADDIQHEQPRVFTTARVLSDVRVIFRPDALDIAGAVVIHQLKITCFHNGDYQDIFIALDNADIETLSSILERAKAKTVRLREMLDTAAVPYFESESTNLNNASNRSST